MKLGKTILGALLGVFALGATANAQIGFIVRGGYQAANIINAAKDSKMAHGARAGVAADITIYDGGMSRISIQPGVDFAMKGYKPVADSKGKDGITTSLYYVDIPVLANFGFDLGNDLGVFVNAGPYLGVGVGGKTSVKGGNASLNLNGNPFDKDGFFNRLDWGAQVGAGVEYNHFQIGVGTQFGIGKIDKESNLKKIGKEIAEALKIQADSKPWRNSNFFVTVGYRF